MSERRSARFNPSRFLLPLALLAAAALGSAVAFMLMQDQPERKIRLGDLRFVGPSRLSDGLEGTNIEFLNDASFFVLDTSSRRLYRLVQDCRVECPRHVYWKSNNELEVETGASVYTVTLAGNVNKLPTAPRDAPKPGPLVQPVSVDGRWTVRPTLTSPATLRRVTIAENMDNVAFLLTNVDPGDTLGFRSPAWSPSSPILAVIGNRCVVPDYSGFDLLLFDPSTAQATNLTEGVEPVLAFAWSSNGDKLALGTVPFNSTGTESITIVQLNGSPPARVVDVQMEGALLPIEWSPDGKRLLFYLLGGGGLCLGGAEPPTRITPLNPDNR